MKEFIQAIYGNKSTQLDLNQVKKIHVNYINELNDTLFSRQPPIIADTPEQITDLLFQTEDYIINWLENKVTWPAVKAILKPPGMTYRQWKKADKWLFHE